MAKNKTKINKILIVAIVSILVMCLLSATFAVYFETNRVDTIESSPRGAYLGEPRVFADNTTTLDDGHAFNFYLTNTKDGAFFNKGYEKITVEFDVQFNQIFADMIYGSEYSIDFQKISSYDGKYLGSLTKQSGGANNLLYKDKVESFEGFVDMYYYRIVFSNVKKTINIPAGEDMFKVDFKAFDSSVKFIETNKASLVIDKKYKGIQINLEPVGEQVPQDFAKVEVHNKVSEIDKHEAVYLIAFKNGRQDKNIGLRLVSDAPGKDSQGRKILIRTMQLYYLDDPDKAVMLDSSYTLSMYIPFSWDSSKSIKYWY